MSDRTYLEQIYKLRRNPFASRVDPNVDMAGRRKEETEWTIAIDRFIGSDANAIHFIVGDYGSGKTLSLYKIVEQYKENTHVLPVFMKMLPEDKIPKFGVDFIQRIFRQVQADIYRRFDLKNIEILENVYPEPAIIFRRIVLRGDDAIEFIRGQRSFSITELTKMGVRHKIDRTDIAKDYLLSFLFLLKSIEIFTLLLAVDETEYVFSQMRGKDIALVFNALRAFYDLTAIHKLPTSTANMIFFFGISTAGWEYLKNLERREQTQPGPIQPLMRRFGEHIELGPLNIDETRELIEKRLRTNRVTGKYNSQPLIPYDETFVEYVFELSLGNPGEIVKYSDYALEEGLKEKAKFLNKNFAEKAFVAHGLIVPIE